MNLDKLTIKQLKKRLQNVEVSEELIQKLAADSRKGVRKLAQKYRNIKNKKKMKLEKWYSMNKIQSRLQNDGFQLIAGFDEAGRGPLAGPVVAAAVILDQSIKIVGLDDSKKLSIKKRKMLFKEINKKAVAIGVGIVDNEIIDKINIHNATFKAMKKALNKLNLNPDFLLVDGNKKIPSLEVNQKAITDGDGKVNCIAAASIIAKVTRDKIIDDYHPIYPEYNFINNKGYGTREHITALEKHGPTPIHRYSFTVVKENAGGNRKIK